MAATPSIKIYKYSSYEGGFKTWSNRYHFLGGTPADNAHWTTLFNAISAVEKQCLTSRHTITGWTGYGAGSDVPLAGGTASVAGTFTIGTNVETPLEVSALVKWQTDVRTSKNHPIYLFKYYRGGLMQSTSGDHEQLSTNQASNLASYAANWVSGFSDGANNYNIAGPNGAAGFTPSVAGMLTHRDFVD